MNLRILYRRHFLLGDSVLSIVLVGIILLLALHIGPVQALVELDKDSRVNLYSVMAAIAGSLLGFAVTGVTILLALLDNRKLRLLRKSHFYSQVYGVFFHAIYTLAGLTLFAILGLLYDRSDVPNLCLFYFIFWFCILTILRIWRCVWVLENIIKIVTSPDPAPPG